MIDSQLASRILDLLRRRALSISTVDNPLPLIPHPIAERTPSPVSRDNASLEGVPPSAASSPKAARAGEMSSNLPQRLPSILTSLHTVRAQTERDLAAAEATLKQEEADAQSALMQEEADAQSALMQEEADAQSALMQEEADAQSALMQTRASATTAAAKACVRAAGGSKSLEAKGWSSLGVGIGDPGVTVADGVATTSQASRRLRELDGAIGLSLSELGALPGPYTGMIWWWVMGVGAILLGSLGVGIGDGGGLLLGLVLGAGGGAGALVLLQSQRRGKAEAIAARLWSLTRDVNTVEKGWLRHAGIQRQERAGAARGARDAWIERARQSCDERVDRARHARDERVDRARQTRDERRRTVMGDYEQRLSELRPQVDEFTKEVEEAVPGWGLPAWSDWQPPTTPASFTRIGLLRAPMINETVDIPAVVAVPHGLSVMFKVRDNGKDVATQGVQNLMLRLLATIPPGKLRFTLIDPVGLGDSFAPFMHLQDYDDALVTNRAWTERQHIEQRLADLSEQMETIIQKYLRNTYSTMEAYNAEAGEVSEPYRVLVIAHFPVNFTDDAARRLVSIASNGARCGVYTVVTVDTQKPMPHGFNLADLERVATVHTWSGSAFSVSDEAYADVPLQLDTPPDTERFTRVIEAVGTTAVANSRVAVPFSKIAPAKDTWWGGSTADEVEVPIGVAGATKRQRLALGQGTAQHVLIVGKTGSGKSTLLHVAIMNLAMTYGPEELELYLIDFKEGVEFKTYATHTLPHARVIAVESEREFGLSVLQGLDAELARRGQLFRDTTATQGEAQKLSVYRQRTGEALPRILLIIDEFQQFFTQDDATSSQAATLLDRLVRQGRSFGIHIMLGSQTLAGSYSLARSTIDQMAVRIALQCSEADSRLVFSDDNPAARLLARPGEAIYNDANGLVEGNNPFQTVWLDDEEREGLLKRLRWLAEEQSFEPRVPQVIFEGRASADLASNKPLHDLLAPNASPATAGVPLAWLGEPIALKPPVAAPFRRQSGSNLLIVGQDAGAAMGITVAALTSLAAHHRGSSLDVTVDALFYVIDFTAADAPHAGLLERLTAGMPYPIQVVGRRGLAEVIGEVATEVGHRLEHDDVRPRPRIYLLIVGLHRARDLRQDEAFDDFPSVSLDDDPPSPVSPAKQFPMILREGPDLGVHTIVWCDTVSNLDRSLDRRAAREFEMRVAFQMSAEDSSNLLDTPAASKLGHARALFSSEDEGRLETFRPYGLPSEAWLAKFVEQWPRVSTKSGEQSYPGMLA